MPDEINKFGLTAPQIPEQLSGEALTPIPVLSVSPTQPALLPDIQNIPTEPIAPIIPKQEPNFLSGIEELEARISGREMETSRRTEQATFDITKQVNELNREIKQLQAEELKATEEARERGETLGFAAGETARVRRGFAIEALRLSATAEALQGNLSLAERQVKRAVDAEFEEVEKNARIARRNILDNYDNLTTAEKKRADATLLRLDKEDQEVKEKKEERNAIEDLRVKVAASGKATNLDLAKFDDVDTEVEAAALAAPFLQKVETGQTEPEIKFSSTQLAGGAAIANMPIADFQKLDQDTQNFFINRKSDIDAKKKLIDTAKENKEDPQALEAEISSSSAPDAVKDSLIRYLKQVFPPQEQNSLPWWKRIGISFGLKL
ncbi:hypothetical protein A3F02_04140 [Candidatus Curtissbacteria bacterium RIFCSPHIGHO2_12_FULL_38_9b]|uniref:Uncharacterized protein n=1 Tax=Candidatus Curtissbacteria bacterium RIFCSPHIGHO2_12_FULL_38_9b TaxID=1797720 RepID=A0A1F5GT98_9BACT|nr:MAG: hypothetical protein A3F02_04140 [Candidatus Curtissbacteria bacterium RIFCSPHIGHO2_12_FULL_38_9b]